MAAVACIHPPRTVGAIWLVVVQLLGTVAPISSLDNAQASSVIISQGCPPGFHKVRAAPCVRKGVATNTTRVHLATPLPWSFRAKSRDVEQGRGLLAVRPTIPPNPAQIKQQATAA